MTTTWCLQHCSDCLCTTKCKSFKHRKYLVILNLILSPCSLICAPPPLRVLTHYALSLSLSEKQKQPSCKFLRCELRSLRLLCLAHREPSSPYWKQIEHWSRYRFKLPRSPIGWRTGAGTQWELEHVDMYCSSLLMALFTSLTSVWKKSVKFLGNMLTSHTGLSYLQVRLHDSGQRLACN